MLTLGLKVKTRRRPRSELCMMHQPDLPDHDCLYPGPKLNQKILDIPLTADIEKAFLMIAVAEPDRDVLRFLWFDDVFLDEPAIVARVVFGVSSSPFLLNATVQHHLEEFLATHHETVTSILQSIMLSSEQKMKRVPISFIENRRRFWGRDHSI